MNKEKIKEKKIHKKVVTNKHIMMKEDLEHLAKAYQKQAQESNKYPTWK